MFHRSLYQLFYHHHYYYVFLEQGTFGYKSGKNLALTQYTLHMYVSIWCLLNVYRIGFLKGFFP